MLVDKTKADILKQANVTDPDLEVNLDIDGDKAAVSADYQRRRHASDRSRSTTTLHFHKTEDADIKKVYWE